LGLSSDEQKDKWRNSWCSGGSDDDGRYLQTIAISTLFKGLKAIEKQELVLN